jgi:aminomethyltransferase
MMAAPQGNAPLRQTPLYGLHVRLGARMVAFAGYAMPVQYPTGIIREHLHTRAAASLFDVSHMGQIALRPKSGRLDEAARALEALAPSDVVGLPPGRQRYTVFTDDAGGVLDDLMVSSQGDHLLLVVNAAGKEADLAHLQAGLSSSCSVELMADRALVALQGPQAEAALAKLAPQVQALRFMDARSVALRGADATVSRSGYTGEDGFEISIAGEKVEELCLALLEDASVAPAGLGARDSLRLEAGLCLYGADLDPGITPVEAALDWAIPKVRRVGGERAGGFPGADAILRQLATGPSRRRVGLKPEGRAPVRGGAAIYADETGAAPIGRVSSGGFAPSLDAPIAMGYVPREQATAGRRLFAEVRGRRLPVRVCELPFVELRYKRP